MDRVVFEEKIPVAFEPEPFENEDVISIPSICLIRRGIQIIPQFQFSTGVTMT